MSDASGPLAEAVRAARAAGEPLWIGGAGTRAAFVSRTPERTLDMCAHRGIVAYEPTELVVTVRAGTPLAELRQALADAGQMLAGDALRVGPAGTVGGAVAHGASGRRRPFTGAVRDHVLGVRLLSARGEILTFGGQVMKNVAGYDVSRLQVGALGMFGALLDVSFKTLPRPECVRILGFERSARQAIEDMQRLASRPLPIAHLGWQDGRLEVELAGTEAAVVAAARELGGDADLQDAGPAIDFSRRWWRLSLPPAAPHLQLPGEWRFAWGGGERWLASEAEAEKVVAASAAAGGYAEAFGGDGAPYRPALDPARLGLHRALKNAFDPERLFNPGVMYPEL